MRPDRTTPMALLYDYWKGYTYEPYRQVNNPFHDYPDGIDILDYEDNVKDYRLAKRNSTLLDKLYDPISQVAVRRNMNWF